MALTMKSAFELSADTKTLAHVLSGVKVGACITYADLSASIARDVRQDAYSNLAAARNLVQRDKSMVFDAVRGEGLKRLDDAEIVALGERTRDHIRRTTRRTGKKLLCVDYEAMPRDQQTKHNTALSMLSIISELASDKAQKRLAGRIESAGTELPAVKGALAALGLQDRVPPAT